MDLKENLRKGLPLIGDGSHPGQRSGRKGRGKARSVTVKYLRATFHEVHEALGGSQGLISWAKENQSEFRRLQAKLEPNDVNIGAEGLSTLADLAKAIAKKK